MKAKALEVRDRGTFIPMLCVDMNPSYGDDPTASSDAWDQQQFYLLRRCGYPCDGSPSIIMTRLDGAGRGRPGATSDPRAWGDRTYAVAHLYILEHWDTLRSGDVVDVEFILGETSEPKISERITAPL